MESIVSMGTQLPQWDARNNQGENVCQMFGKDGMWVYFDCLISDFVFFCICVCVI